MVQKPRRRQKRSAFPEQIHPALAIAKIRHLRISPLLPIPIFGKIQPVGLQLSLPLRLLLPPHRLRVHPNSPQALTRLHKQTPRGI